MSVPGTGHDIVGEWARTRPQLFGDVLLHDSALSANARQINDASRAHWPLAAERVGTLYSS